MSLTIDDIVENPSLRTIFLAGQVGGQRKVDWAHNTEVEEPWNWLSAGELLLTLGRNFPATSAEQIDFIKNLSDAGLAGLDLAAGWFAPPLTPEAAKFAGIFIPNWVFDNFGTFVAYIGVFFAPLCGIMIIDYFLLRKGQISIRGIYDTANKSVYRYWGGFNPAAVIAMVVGFYTYTYLLDPISYAVNTPFQIVGASLPAALMSALAYALVTVLVVKPAGKGGYK